jgi:lysozyme family protein
LIKLQTIKAAFAALILSTIFTTSLQANYTYEGDGYIGKKALKKLEEMGNELFEKTGVSTVIVAKEHLDQKEFLEIKDRYLKELKNPYVLWIFSKTYMDRKNIGINQMFSSDDVKDKFDQDSMFSPWGGTFSKILTVHKSKSDPTAAAFLNGYADLTDMIASSYGVKLDSSIGSETKTTINIVRIFFYLIIAFFFVWYLQIKFSKGKKADEH